MNRNDTGLHPLSLSASTRAKELYFILITIILVIITLIIIIRDF